MRSVAGSKQGKEQKRQISVTKLHFIQKETSVLVRNLVSQRLGGFAEYFEDMQICLIPAMMTAGVSTSIGNEEKEKKLKLRK